MSPEKRILVIDDDEVVFLYLSKKLGHRYDLITTTEPVLALALAVQEDPDLILCDIGMPDLDGGELSCRFFECEATRRIPFAYLTSIVSPDEVRRRQGCIGHRFGIAKATPAPVMIEMIEQMLN